MTAAEDTVRVSTLELFFDLVFVFTITQLTAMLVTGPTNVFPAVLILGVTWWMYSGYAWLTNAVPATTTVRRLLLLAGMAGFLTMALAIPKAFGGEGIVYGIGYLLVTVVHMVLFTKSTTQSAVRAILRLAPFNLVSAVLVLIAGLVGGIAEFIMWSAAILLQVITPYVAGDEGFMVRPGHFVERHGLVVLIAFGESIVAIGIGATGLTVDFALVCVALLGLALTGCLWWTYFDGDDVRAEHALAAVPHQRRPRVALISFGYAHLVLLFGVVTLAAGMKKAVGHAFEHASPAGAWYLGSGVALFLLGDVCYRVVLGIGRNTFRLTAAALAIATVPLGLTLPSVGQLSALVIILTGALVAERVPAQVTTR